jgi:hypothetical protein
VVEVTPLYLANNPKPHLELLCYRGVRDRSKTLVNEDDVAATRLVFVVDDDFALRRKWLESWLEKETNCGSPKDLLLRDPDGHIIELRRGVRTSVE